MNSGVHRRLIISESLPGTVYDTNHFLIFSYAAVIFEPQCLRFYPSIHRLTIPPLLSSFMPSVVSRLTAIHTYLKSLFATPIEERPRSVILATYLGILMI